MQPGLGTATPKHPRKGGELALQAGLYTFGGERRQRLVQA